MSTNFPHLNGCLGKIQGNQNLLNLILKQILKYLISGSAPVFCGVHLANSCSLCLNACSGNCIWLNGSCQSFTDQTPHGFCAYWFHGALLYGVSLFGILGNLLSIIILCGPTMQNSFNRLLAALATFDSLFIILTLANYAFFDQSIIFDYRNEIHGLIVGKLIHPLKETIFCCCVSLTVSVSYERYLSLIHI